MKLDELKDRIVEYLKARWEQLRESSLYLRAKEKYDDLTPSAQKLVQIGAGILVFLVLVTFPWSWMTSSSDNVRTFENRRSVIRQLLQLKRDLAQAPQVPLGIPSSQLKAQVQTAVSALGLTTEQVKGMDEVQLTPDPTSSLIPKAVAQEGVQLSVWKINLTQFVDLSYRLQKLNSISKLISIDMQANGQDPHYYDVIFQIASFSVPGAAASKAAGDEDSK